MRKVAAAKPPSAKPKSAGMRRREEMEPGYLPGQRDWEPGNEADGFHYCIVTEPPPSSGEDSMFDRFAEMGYEVAQELSTTKRRYRIPIEDYNARVQAARDLAAERRRTPIVTADGAKETRKQLAISESELLDRVESMRDSAESEDN